MNQIGSSGLHHFYYVPNYTIECYHAPYFLIPWFVCLLWLITSLFIHFQRRKHKCALLSNFSSSIQLCNFQGDPYHVRDINNSIPLYCNVSYAPELSHFSSLPQDQLSELELRLVYAHVDAYSVGRSFYQNIFLRKTEPFPLQVI